MSLRHYLHRLEQRGSLVQVHTPVSKIYAASGILKKLEPAPVLFTQVRESPLFMLLRHERCRPLTPEQVADVGARFPIR